MGRASAMLLASKGRSGTITVNTNNTNWTGATGQFTYDATGIYRASGGYNFSTQKSTADLAGDFEFRFKFPNETGTGSAGSTATFQFGLSTASGTVGSGLNSPYQVNNSSLWFLTVNGTGSQTVTLYNQNTSLGTASRTIASGDILGIRRTGTALTAIHNGVDIATFTGFSSSSAMYPMLGHGGSGNGSPWKFQDVTWEVNIS